MTKFEFRETKMPGLIEVTPFNADDVRGCFTKDYSKAVFEATVSIVPARKTLCSPSSFLQ